MNPKKWNWRAKNWTTKKLRDMKKFKVAITIEAETPETVQKVGNLIQNAVNKVEQKDIIRLLEKVSQNPGIVKTALKFI